jgi:hypothetical protein
MPDTSLIVAAVAAGGALAAGATALSRPRLALAILFFLASISRATLETPLGTMRPEMPAIAVVTVVLLVGGRFSILRTMPRSALFLALAFGMYLGVLGVSSAVIAPGTAQSLRMVAWLTISMAGGVVAFVLVQRRPLGAIGPLALAGAAMGLVGIFVALMFFVAGPRFDLGIQDPGTILPRVYGLGWEANLYASFLGMSAFFMLEAARGPRRAAGFIGLALVLVGFCLGVTRGAYLGLGVGAVAYSAVRLTLERRPGELARLAAVAAVFLLVGIAASSVLLPNAFERGPSGPTVAPTQSSSTAASPPRRDGPSAPPVEAASRSPSSSSSASSPTTSAMEPYPDTVAFRLERVYVALDDLPSSPLIGFGAESFGQRHPERYAGPGPDHIAIMAVVVLYESGIVGAAALAIGFAVLLGRLIQAARRSSDIADWRTVGAAAAFIGSLVSMLVSYQATNALQFAVNWIVIGAATALTTPELHSESRPAVQR